MNVECHTQDQSTAFLRRWKAIPPLPSQSPDTCLGDENPETSTRQQPSVKLDLHFPLHAPPPSGLCPPSLSPVPLPLLQNTSHINYQWRFAYPSCHGRGCPCCSAGAFSAS